RSGAGIECHPMRLPLACALAACFVGCGGSSSSTDLGVDQARPADLAVPLDLYGVDLARGVGACRPDPMGDQQSGPTMTGPMGEGGVSFQGSCQCFYGCTPGAPDQCYCNRFCDPLCTPADGGCQPNGTGACLPSNGPGERCASDSAGKPYGK